MTKRIFGMGFSTLMALITTAVALFAILAFYALFTYKRQGDDMLNKTAITTGTTVNKTPSTATLPATWISYTNMQAGIKLGYPKEWGRLDATTLKTPEYRDDARNMQGVFSISVSRKDSAFTVVAQKYGATIKPGKDGKGWVVVSENPAKVDDYKVGDVYKPIVQTVSGGQAIDLSYTDENCTQTRWLFTTKTSYVVTTLPQLCPVDQVKISDANQSAYADLITRFLSSVTVF